MRISTRLVLTILAPALMGLIVIVLIAFSYQSTHASKQNGTRVSEIRDSLTNLNGYVYSYLLFPGDRPHQQFTAEYEVLTQLITGVHLHDPEQQELLENIRLNSVAMNDMFLQFQAQQVGSNPAAEARLQGSLLIKSRDADVNASLLKKSLDDQINATQITSTALIFIVVLVLTIPFTVILIRMRKHITSSLNKLHVGTEAVGGGNLDYRMNLTVRDELGDLARSFDSMTEKLQAITVSRVRLQQEVEERIKAEEELKRYTLELESANKELEAFSYSVSHDLRQPLRALDGFSLAVVNNLGDKLDETNKDYLDRVRKASQTMGRLIDDLLKLSRITRAEMSYDSVNLSELAGTIAEDLRRTQPERQADFLIAPALMVEGDLPLLNVALKNLLENSWKYTSKCPHTLIEMGKTKQNGESVFFIRDNGAGFDMKYSEKLFQPFQRLHSSSEYEGTGIGLATVLRIVRRHGGRVWADSHVGKGTTIYFTLDKG